MYPEVPLDQRIDQAESAVLATVLFSESYWSADRKFIYTRHHLEVHQSIQNNQTFIDIITQGGTVDSIHQQVEPSVNLQTDETGIFLLENSDIIHPDPKVNLLQPVGQNLGHFYIPSNSKKCFGVFEEFEINDLIKIIADQKGAEIVSNDDTAFKYNTNDNNPSPNAMMPSIGAFDPPVVTSGTLTELSIFGSGFGNSYTGDAAVKFKHPDFTSAANFEVPANHILFWTDNEIRVIVPGNDVSNGKRGAATGKVWVVDSNGNETVSPNDLYVTYHKTVNQFEEIDLTSTGNNGSFIIQTSQNYIALGGMPALQNAIDEWNCKTACNFVVSGTQNFECSGFDYINLVSFDQDCVISSLASTRTTTATCSGGEAMLLDADIIFSFTTAWNLGPNPTQVGDYDLESTLIHEIGHIHQLGHVLNSDVMYPFLGSGVDQREVTPESVEGGLAVMVHSVNANICSPLPITPFNNSSCNNAPPTAAFSSSVQNACVGETVSFNDQSLNNPNSWLWFFEGGNPATSTMENPSVTYTTPGTYDVTLIVSNGNGSNTLELTDYITVEVDCCAPPEVAMSSNVTSSSFTINWAAVPNATSYNVRIRTSGAQAWTNFSSSFTIGVLSGLNACTTYEIQIQPVCSNTGPGDFSQSFFVNTEGCVGCVAPPGLYSYNTTQSSAALTWDIIPNATSYEVRYKKLSDPDWFYYDSPFPLVILFGLDPCDVYEYAVTTNCGNNSTSSLSSSIFFTTNCQATFEDDQSIQKEDAEIKFYPNPVHNWMTIQNDDEVYTHASVINLQGQVVHEFELNGSQTNIDLQFLASGVYVLNVFGEDQMLKREFIKH